MLALGDEFDVRPNWPPTVSAKINLNTMQADLHSPPLARGLTLHLHATDDGLGPTGEWTITNDEDGLNWSHDHAKGDAAVRGRAGTCCWRSPSPQRRRGRLEVFGDPAVWDGWLSRTPF